MILKYTYVMSRLLRCALICGVYAGFGMHDQSHRSVDRHQGQRLKLSLQEVDDYGLRSAMHAKTFAEALRRFYSDYEERRNELLADKNGSHTNKVTVFVNAIARHGKENHGVAGTDRAEWHKVHDLFIDNALAAPPEESPEYRESLGRSVGILARALLEYWTVEASRDAKRFVPRGNYAALGKDVACYLETDPELRNSLMSAISKTQSCPEYANVAVIEEVRAHLDGLLSRARENVMRGMSMAQAKELVGFTDLAENLQRQLANAHVRASGDYRQYLEEMQSVQHQCFVEMLGKTQGSLSDAHREELKEIVKSTADHDTSLYMSPMLTHKESAQCLEVGKQICGYVRGNPRALASLVYIDSHAGQQTSERVASLFVGVIRAACDDGKNNDLFQRLCALEESQYHSQVKVVMLGWFRELLMLPPEPRQAPAAVRREVSLLKRGRSSSGGIEMAPLNNMAPLDTEGLRADMNFRLSEVGWSVDGEEDEEGCPTKCQRYLAGALALSAFPWAYAITVAVRAVAAGPQAPLDPQSANNTDPTVCKELLCCSNLENSAAYFATQLYDTVFSGSANVEGARCTKLVVSDMQSGSIAINTFCAYNTTDWARLTEVYPNATELVKLTTPPSIFLGGLKHLEYFPMTNQCRVYGCDKPGDVVYGEAVVTEKDLRSIVTDIGQGKRDQLAKSPRIASLQVMSLSAAQDKLRTMIAAVLEMLSKQSPPTLQQYV